MQAPALSVVDSPVEARVGATFAIVSVTVDEVAEVAWTAVLRDAAAPTVQQMLTESTPHAVAAGTFTVTTVGAASEHTVYGLTAATAYDVYLLPASSSGSGRRRQLLQLGADALFVSAFPTLVQVSTGATPTAPTAVMTSDTGSTTVSTNPFNVTITWDREVRPALSAAYVRVTAVGGEGLSAKRGWRDAVRIFPSDRRTEHEEKVCVDVGMHAGDGVSMCTVHIHLRRDGDGRRCGHHSQRRPNDQPVW